MNKEKRKELKDSYEAMIKERNESKERILANYKKLSYRDKLLFAFVVHFLVENPKED